MSQTFGGQTMVGPLARVGVRRPGPALLQADPVRWHYGGPLDADTIEAQHRAFVEIVGGSGAEVVYFDDPSGDEDPPVDDDLADSVFVYDPSFVFDAGVVILAMGKELRQGEAELHRNFYERQSIPVLGTIEAPGLVEGGDCFWLDDTTLAVGRGFRTNSHGIEQLRSIVQPVGVEVVAYDLPYGAGPEACLHLLSVISPVDHNLALVHAPMLPAPLHQDLVDRGWNLVVAPPEEFEASFGLNLNVLALSPRHAVMIDGFPKTRALLEAQGCTIEVFPGDQLCMLCEGGPTCLTRPLLRH